MILNLKKLHNVYYILRHGNSKANEEGIIVSDPQHGTVGYGLTEQGKSEVTCSVQKAKDDAVFVSSPVIFASDFIRAKETADIAASILRIKEVILSTKLRERFFGQLEKTSNTNYQRVWDVDEEDYTHKRGGVESVAEVKDRVISLLDEIEKKYSEQSILLVSHGDTLQILQTLFEQVHPSRHRHLSHLKTAEIRRLN